MSHDYRFLPTDLVRKTIMTYNHIFLIVAGSKRRYSCFQQSVTKNKMLLKSNLFSQAIFLFIFSRISGEQEA